MCAGVCEAIVTVEFSTLLFGLFDGSIMSTSELSWTLKLPDFMPKRDKRRLQMNFVVFSLSKID